MEGGDTRTKAKVTEGGDTRNKAKEAENGGAHDLTEEQATEVEQWRLRIQGVDDNILEEQELARQVCGGARRRQKQQQPHPRS